MTPKQENQSFFRSLRFRYGLGLLFLFAIGGYFLWAEHGDHILRNGGLLLALGICVGMHFFMHRGHSGAKPHHGDGKQHNDRNDAQK